VPDLSDEPHLQMSLLHRIPYLWRLEWVLAWNLDVNLEGAALVARVFLTSRGEEQIRQNQVEELGDLLDRRLCLASGGCCPERD